MCGECGWLRQVVEVVQAWVCCSHKHLVCFFNIVYDIVVVLFFMGG